MSDVLAVVIYYPSHDGKNYYEEDLKDEKTVEELFDYCGIQDGFIKPAGWKFLSEYYGYEKLYEINERSGYLWVDSVEEFVRDIEDCIKGETAL